MTAVLLMKLMVAFTGFVFLLVVFYQFSRRRLVANIGLGWLAFTVQLMLVGCIPRLSAWAEIIAPITFFGLYCLGFFALLGTLLLSITVSKLIMRNHELAMQVSLLNQENEKIRRDMEQHFKQVQPSFPDIA
ncbi:MAG: DUF2304 domain-containing protein [Clostridium sp.]|jgi:hypothetical protein|nr:DUF2304 domain-containing protein [Clostridium sp.]